MRLAMLSFLLVLLYTWFHTSSLVRPHCTPGGIGAHIQSTEVLAARLMISYRLEFSVWSEYVLDFVAVLSGAGRRAVST